MPRQHANKLAHHGLSAGRPAPLGATWDGEGVNFAVFSAEAELVELCLYSADGRTETARIPLRERDGDIWHVYVAGLLPGTLYGYRAHGRYAPEEGLRFNAHKLLIDPYAKALTAGFKWSDTLYGYRYGTQKADLSFDTRDSAFAVPKSIVVDPAFAWGNDAAPRVEHAAALHYEAHVKGMTAEHPQVEAHKRGSFLGMASAPVLDHLTKLGVTTVQLMPVQAALSERFLAEKGLSNYWGYNTIGFFAPDPRFLTQGQVWEFQTMVKRFHSAGIEVLLDVVYNHSAEGNELGPTLSLRGLCNRSYYKLAEAKRYYVNETGCGNTLDLSQPAVLRLVMDSLRYWREVMHVDGFRFDLATSLARGPQGFDRKGGFLSALGQDPSLCTAKLVAEPWDLAGYHLGQFPHPFLELNDRFRDDLRRFWRGDAGMVAGLAKRIAGTAERFDHAGRAATSSVNFITAHDGFTLEDLVSYSAKQNWANGEENRDGHEPNHAEAIGGEGPVLDAAALAARGLRKRNLLASLFLAQGTPMLLAGDEIGNSQGGNNNAYAQDNPIGWLDWARPDRDLMRFVQRLSALRRAHPVLRQRLFLHSRPRAKDGIPDLFWRLPDGRSLAGADWHDPSLAVLCVELRAASATPAYAMTDEVIFAVFNRGAAQEVQLPAPQAGRRWRVLLRSDAPEAEAVLVAEQVEVSGNSIAVFDQVSEC